MPPTAPEDPQVPLCGGDTPSPPVCAYRVGSKFLSVLEAGSCRFKGIFCREQAVMYKTFPIFFSDRG